MTLLEQTEQSMMTTLREMIKKQGDAVRDLKKREVSQATRAVQRILYADLPTPSSDYEGWEYCVTNGRKSGESAGAGTGVHVMCLNGSGGYQWRLTSDYSVVTA